MLTSTGQNPRTVPQERGSCEVVEANRKAWDRGLEPGHSEAAHIHQEVWAETYLAPDWGPMTQGQVPHRDQQNVQPAWNQSLEHPWHRDPHTPKTWLPEHLPGQPPETEFGQGSQEA